VRRAALLLSAGVLALAGCGGGDDDKGDSGGSGGGGTSTAANTEAIALPATLGTYKDIVEVTKSKNPQGSAVASIEKRIGNTTKLTTAAYSDAFGGAASAFRAYSDNSLEQMPNVVAVRAEAPGITYGPVADPADLGLAKNQNEVQKVGEVECLIFWEPVIAGRKPEPRQEHVRQCQRVGDGRTAFVFGNGFDGPDGLSAMANLTDQAWTATG
jgi:hypothetical protein